MTIKVLVTGADGQLAKTIQEMYKANAENIEFMFLSKGQLDITNKKAIESIFQNQNINYCINTAAYTNVEQAEKTPDIAFKINAEAVKNLAEVCKAQHSILIHISTDYVFDGDKHTPYTIHDVPNPINQYGASKLLGETYVQSILTHYFIIRTSWLYSKTYGHNFYKKIIELAKTESEIKVTHAQTGCPTETIDLANYIFKLISSRSTQFGTVHVTGNVTMTWYEFAKKILTDNNLSETVKLVKNNNYRTFAKRPTYSVLK